jgi:hypothetical protein
MVLGPHLFCLIKFVPAITAEELSEHPEGELVRFAEEGVEYSDKFHVSALWKLMGGRAPRETEQDYLAIERESRDPMLAIGAAYSIHIASGQAGLGW